MCYLILKILSINTVVIQKKATYKQYLQLDYVYYICL